MKYLQFFLLALIIFVSCKEDEELISGDISGYVILYDRNYNPFPAQQGVKVNLFLDSDRIDSTVTDENGSYLFKDLTYGRYDISCSYEGFICSWGRQPIFHVGGYSPTIANFSLHQIPDYQIQIDSITYFEEDNFLILHLKLDGDTVLPGNSYSYMFRAFMSNSPNISKDNYSAISKGMLADWPLDYTPGIKVAAYGRILSYEISNFDQIKSQPVYLILYPVANNQGYFPTEFLLQSLGPASNVVSFNWNEISGE
jgi:hypothetical protein